MGNPAVGRPVSPRPAKGLSPVPRVAVAVDSSSEVCEGRELSMMVDKPTMMGAEVLEDADAFDALDVVRDVGVGSLPNDGKRPVGKGSLNGQSVGRS